ncbi:hypothetical protein [Flaviaesturariibacter terrae]
MIQPAEIRWGNSLLHKRNGKVQQVACGADQFSLIAQGRLADLYPVLLKAEVLLANGFTENKDYALYPQAREFRRVLVVKSGAQHELLAYVKSNGECLAWATANGLQSSNAVFQLHQLQNLHFALTGLEL